MVTEIEVYLLKPKFEKIIINFVYFLFKIYFIY